MKKLFALMLSIAMVVSMFSGIAFAAGTPAQIALAKIDLYAATNGTSTAPDITDYTTAGATATVVGNTAAYNAEVVKADRVLTLVALQTIVNNVNAVVIAEANMAVAKAVAVARLNLYAIANNAAELTVDELVTAGLKAVDVKVAYIADYKTAIAGLHGVALVGGVATEVVTEGTARTIEAIIKAINLAKDPAPAATALAEINLMAAQNDASALTFAKLDLVVFSVTTPSASTAVEANLARYKLAIAAKDGFATAAALKAEVDAVNAAVAAEKLVSFQTAVATLNYYAVTSNATALTTQLLLDAGVPTATVLAANLPGYKTAIAVLTKVLVVEGVVTGYRMVGTPAVETAFALNTIIADVNVSGPTDAQKAAALALINIYHAMKNATNLTVTDLVTAGATAAIEANLAGYKYAVANALAPFTATSLIEMVANVNTGANPVARAKLNVFAVSNDASTMTIADLVAAGVTSAKAENLAHYQAMVANYTFVDMSTPLQSDVVTLNASITNRAAALKVINDFAVANNASTMEVAQLNATGLTDWDKPSATPPVVTVITANLAKYKTAVAAASGFATLNDLYTVIKGVNDAVVAEAAANTAAVKERTALASINLYAVSGNASALTIQMLKDAKVTGTVDTSLAAYVAAIAAKTEGLPTLASIQAVIDAVNNKVIVPVITHNAPLTTEATTFNLVVTVTDDTLVTGVIFEGAMVVAFPNKTVMFTRTLSLAMGVNTFTVSATDGGGNVTTKQIAIARTAPAVRPPIVIRLGVANPAIGLDVAPELRNGRTMLPFRWFGETVLGIETQHITWDQTTGTVTMMHGGKTVVLTINSMTASVNGVAVQLDAAPFIINGRTMVNARFLAETFGFTITWNSVTNDVTIWKN